MTRIKIIKSFTRQVNNAQDDHAGEVLGGDNCGGGVDTRKPIAENVNSNSYVCGLVTISALWKTPTCD